MEFIILLFIILTIAAAITNLLKRKIELSLPISAITITLIVYLLGLFDNVDLGVKIVQLLAAVATYYNIFCMIKSIKNKQIKEDLKLLITPGLLVYVVLFFFFMIINKERLFEHYDEFNHWAVIIKNMFQYNGFGTVEKSIVKFNEYPPFTASFQYIVLNIKGAYKEDAIIISQNILYLSMMIPICHKMEFGKKLKKLLIVLPAIVILPLILYEDFFVNILVDGFLGILFAIGLFCVYNSEEDKNYYAILLSFIMVALSLTKTTGVALSVLLLVFKIIKAILDRKQEGLKKQFVTILIIAILPIVFTSAWYLKIGVTQSHRQWTIGENAGEESGKENNVIITKFLEAFWKNEELTVRKFNMLCIVLLLTAYSIYVFKIQKEKMEKRNYKYVLIATIISIIIFAIGLLGVYLLLFTKIEATVIGCYERYMSTVLIAWLFLNTFILCQKEVNASIIYVFMAITIVLMPTETISQKYIEHKQYCTNQQVKRNYYTTLKKYKSVLNENDKIFFLTNTDMHDEKILNMNQYELMGLNIQNDSLRVTNDYAKRILTTSEIEKLLVEEEYTYLYVYRIKESAREQYKDLLNSTDNLNNTLYKVKVENNNLVLEMVK